MFKYKYSKLYWFFKEFSWMAVYFSPFKPPIPRLYIGKVAIGTPYFLPRVWRKATPERAHKAVEDYIKREENYNKLNPDYARKIKPYNEVFAEKMKYSYAVPLKVGFSSCGMGWKTKWTNTDYRFEYSPVWSFVFFGYQIAITFVAVEAHHFWECWLYYSRETKHIAKTTKARLVIAKKGFPCKWTSHNSDGTKVTTDYWTKILKNKWL